MGHSRRQNDKGKKMRKYLFKYEKRKSTDQPNAYNLEIENSSTELNFLAAKYGF